MSLVEALWQLLLPRACIGCEAPIPDHEPGLACGRCWSRLPLLSQPQCARCGHPQPPRGACPVCPLLPAHVRALRSVCWVPEGTSTPLVAGLKYHGWHRIAGDLALRMARLPWPPDVLRERAALIPVPLAPAKRRARGYNQAERLAAGIAARWGIPVWDDVLVRTRATPSQTALTPTQRLANVHGAFTCADGAAERIAGRHLVLVDDVFTTGATLNACAAALCEAGARILSYVTFGRARTPADRR